MSFVWSDGNRQTIDMPGGSIECASWGPSPSEAPTLVLLHEGLGCLELWRDFPQRLAEATGAGVFAYSRLGYGRSDPTALPRPLDYMTREACDVLPGILDAIGLQRGLLVGHSDGASIAAIYAGSISDPRIRGLVLMAPHFFTEEMGLAEIADAKVMFDSSSLHEKMGRYHNDAEATFRGWNDAWLHPDFKNWNVGDCIDHWRIPALAIQGEDDQYGTLAQIREMEERAYSPVETVILKGCRHSPHLDQPEKTITSIADFYGRLERLEQEKVKVA